MIELLKKVLYRLGLWAPQDLRRAVSKFVAVNSSNWAPHETPRAGHILVEGHLAEYGPNYAFRTGLAARSLQEALGVEAHVVFNGFPMRWTMAKRIYRSFGITSFIFLGSARFLLNLWWIVKGGVFAVQTVSKLQGPEDILNIKFGAIKVGDLIYDDVLKWCRLRTICSVDFNVWNAIRKSYYYYLQYLALFSERRYLCYVCTHSSYSEYGILCRVALDRGTQVIETTDIQLAFYKGITLDSLPTYHDGVRNCIIRALAAPKVVHEELRASAREALQLRLTSQISQIDAAKAYRGRVYTRAELQQALGLNGNGRIVFVLAHVFSDSPHCSSGMLHLDYYQWLISTLRVCATIGGVQWVVKSHPNASLYGESGMVEEIVVRTGAPNVVVCPPDLNTRSLLECADALVTVTGTAGLEYACLGLPVLLAGQPFYRGFGFTLEPRTVSEYAKALADLAHVSPLSTEQKQRALEVYAIWDQQFDWNNPIITTEVLANVWGSDQPRNLERAYDVIARNLQGSDPRKLKLWTFAQSIAGIFGRRLK